MVAKCKYHEPEEEETCVCGADNGNNKIVTETFHNESDVSARLKSSNMNIRKVSENVRQHSSDCRRETRAQTQIEEDRM